MRYIAVFPTLTLAQKAARVLKSENIELSGDMDRDLCSRARFFPTTGGVLKTMAQDMPGYTYLALDGIENCVNALKDIENGNKIDEKYLKTARELNSMIDVYAWNEVTNLEEANKLLDISGAFHDSYIRDLKYTFPKPYEDENKENLLRTYSIEYFEEYLYNYASDDGYDVVQDGMEWGLEGQQLSTKYQAIYADSDESGGIMNWLSIIGFDYTDFYNTAFNGVDTKYDFYLTRDEPPAGATIRDFAGLKFTQELINQGKLLDDNGNITSTSIAANDRLLSQSKKIQSAVEYCYNKNKRNPETGKVEKINWYLPAIDQTEEILLAGFDYFPVFQSKYYWSSQPAYKEYYFEALTSVGRWEVGNAYGNYYKDDRANARATKVTATQTEEFSGVNGTTGYFPISVNITGISSLFPLKLSSSISSSPDDERDYVSGDEEYYDDGDIHQPGNQPRSTPNRVRCAYSATGLPVTPTSN